jgi:hypothetical protein
MLKQFTALSENWQRLITNFLSLMIAETDRFQLSKKSMLPFKAAPQMQIASSSIVTLILLKEAVEDRSSLMIAL